MIRIFQMGEVEEDKIFARTKDTTDVSAPVREIIGNVIARGDAALIEYCEKFDGAAPSPLEVTVDMIDAACEEVGEDFMELLENASKNIRAYHKRQIRTGYEMKQIGGIVLGQKIMPIENVGIYVPGGTAAYPSTVLMNAIPAKLAGCKNIVMVSPPTAGGRIAPAILAAAHVAGVDRIFQIGGAQAVAALAYGTESVPRVDKIVGPGNIYVAEAKRQVFGQVAIDMIAGPSEILIVADAKNDPKIVAADLLSQAEHDKNASAVLVTESFLMAQAVAKQIERQIPKLPRAEIARASIDNNGKIIIAKNIDEAIEVANRIAPEHLELMVDNCFDRLEQVKNAGSVFLGRYTPEALGDYFAGPNHTLPTGGTARFSSALSVDDFIKKTQYLYYTRAALAGVAADVYDFAQEEGLGGHAKSAVIRIDPEVELF